MGNSRIRDFHELDNCNTTAPSLLASVPFELILVSSLVLLQEEKLISEVNGDLAGT